MSQKHLRSRDVPHPERKRHFAQESPAGRGTAHVDGPNGSWPAWLKIRANLGSQRGVKIGNKNLGEPRPPAICFLYADLAELEDLEQPEPVFGQYPAAFIGKILPWLRCRRHEVVHVCSGSLPRGEGIRVDIRPKARPDIVADGRHLPFRDGSVAAVLLDPPYTEHYARDLYGVAYPRPSHLLREAARVVRPCGRIGIVHYITPNPPPNCTLIRVFGLSTGMGFPMRAVTIFERSQDELRWERATGTESA